MYNLPAFKENDKAVLLAFIRQHPFAFMAGCDEDCKPVATQIPVFMEERGDAFFLSGHMMRNTDHHKAFAKNQAVLCVFTGPHAYVSATWYRNPHQASTWNYMSVHVKGNIAFLNEEKLLEVLKKTSLHFENNNPASATVYQNLPHDYTKALLNAIVAFEVEVLSIENVFKLSQNKDAESYENIIHQLQTKDAGARAIAEEMQQRKAALFRC